MERGAGGGWLVRPVVCRGWGAGMSILTDGSGAGTSLDGGGRTGQAGNERRPAVDGCGLLPEEEAFLEFLAATAVAAATAEGRAGNEGVDDGAGTSQGG